MAPINFAPLPTADEDALHNVARLFLVELRPATRIAHRLTLTTPRGREMKLSDVRPTQLPSPPPDASAADEEAAANEAVRAQELHKIDNWKKEVANELELLDYTTLRFELTTGINKEERDRYAKEKIAITEKQAHVRQNIEKLHLDLQTAKETLAVRKTYDELTEKITSSKMLKPRDEQAVAHAKLDEEIAELEQEVQNAKTTWAERREQFNRIEAEAMSLMRMIKDEKEEAERKEGMMKDRDEEGDGEGTSTRGDASHAATPKPDGGVTPIHVSQSADSSSGLKIPQDRLAPLSAAGSPAKSGAGEDTEMGEPGMSRDADMSEVEEGEDLEEGEHEEDDAERGEILRREMDTS